MLSKVNCGERDMVCNYSNSIIVLEYRTYLNCMKVIAILMIV